jgi:hypothetical protein
MFASNTASADRAVNPPKTNVFEHAGKPATRKRRVGSLLSATSSSFLTIDMLDVSDTLCFVSLNSKPRFTREHRKMVQTSQRLNPQQGPLILLVLSNTSLACVGPRNPTETAKVEG